MQNKKVSIIVPVFNGEKFLNDAIASITKQTYTNIEIIIIDDGSYDSSPIICDEWAKKDSRVICTHQKNSGVSSARNYGLDIASGEFVMFCDADDWLDESYLETLINHIEKHQLAIGSFQQDVEIGMKKREFEDTLDTDFNKVVFLDHCANGKIYTYTVWGKLFKRQLIGNTRFIPLSYSEDAIFVRTVLSNCDSAVFVDTSGYHYRINSNSVTSDIKRAEERVAGALVLIYFTLMICKEKKYKDKYETFKRILMNELISYLKTAIKYPICKPKKSTEILNKCIDILAEEKILFKLKLTFFKILFDFKCYFCPNLLISLNR